ncbi:MAG: hypothetical protein DBX67_01730 [Desulfovibrionaceae bacterium]|nr:hypothetical protein [Desulfovibrionaceae bacterium]PWM70965.1 MAG: hypothetical protein DBX67_01730 [Desulfovibrionaceae bacterium]
MAIKFIDLLITQLHEACICQKLYHDPRLAPGERMLNFFVTDFMSQLIQQGYDIAQVKRETEIAFGELERQGYVREEVSMPEIPILTEKGLEYFFSYDKIS